MAICKLSALAICLFLSNAAKGESTQARDPYIVCPGNQVPDHDHGLPHGYSTNDYFNVMQLCSALNGNSKSVGCVCSSSQESSFYCHPGVADPNLYHAVITHSLKPFPTFCDESCFCTDAETAEMDRAGTADEHQHQQWFPIQQSGQHFDPNDADYQIYQPGGESEGGYRVIPGDHVNGWDAEETLDKGTEATKVAVAHGQCWANCTSNADCLAGGEKGCICSTQKEQYQPGSGTTAFVAACIISMSGLGGKREEMRPCPCNATYVSHACCGVTGGLVWEDERFKLGELAVELKF